MSKEVLTEELLKELLSRPDISKFIDEKQLQDISFSECLNFLMNSKKLSRKEIIHKTSINETHAYQMFQGTRGASRNKVLQLAIAMGLTLKETDRLLHSAGVSRLYCKNRRDAIIIFCIEHQYSLQEVDNQLYNFEEETLSSE